MMEADSKAIWNLPFFLCPYLNHRIFIYRIIVIFMEQPKVFHHKSFFFHN